uniref:HEPN domain protein n=1 Tax=mine drainage metagenome TaxID=410659 RepID=E6QBB9_9ZZZZ
MTSQTKKSVRELMEKARRAAKSADLLYKAGDFDGAANRSYYAMHDAAKAALLAIDAPCEVETIKTHHGLIAAFGLHVVKIGKVPAEFGRKLNEAENLRMIADYHGGQTSQAVAKQLVGTADAFAKEVEKRVTKTLGIGL